MTRLSVPAMIAAARRYGLTVEVVPGADTRGGANFHPQVFVGHHTAGPKVGVRPSLNVCVNGRSDLAGPLCNWFLDRNGVCVIVAAGVANHAGAGGFRGVSGNSNAQGCEAEDDGDGNWTDAQLWAYPRVVAAGLSLMRRDPGWYCAHRTWAPTRKIDPTGISDEWMRDQVRALDDNLEDEDMFTPDDRKKLDQVHDQIRRAVTFGQSDFAGSIQSIGNKTGALINLENASKGATEAIQAALADISKAIAGVQASTDLQGDDEAVVLAELHNTEQRLTALINPPFPS